MTTEPTMDVTCCPHCGTSVFDDTYDALFRLDEETNIERSIAVAPDGRLRFAGDELRGDDSSPRAYVCDACGEELPAAHARELDRRLGVDRTDDPLFGLVNAGRGLLGAWEDGAPAAAVERLQGALTAFAWMPDDM
jgi:hypothetical protein